MAGRSLPKFRNPPITEVVVGIQFTAIEQIAVVQGLLFGIIKERFPIVQTQPPLAPFFETAPPGFPQPFPHFIVSNPSPRAIYISQNDESVIQLQSDRLVFGWRSRGDSYPHFESIQGDFWSAYENLLAALKEVGAPEVTPNQCEVAYINELPEAKTGLPVSRIDGVLLPWRSDFSVDWQHPLEDLSFTARYQIIDPSNSKLSGRLNVILGTYVGGSGEKFLRLDLLARGTAFGEGKDGVVKFQNTAHELIVECFAAITSPAMHEKWGRI